MKRIFCILLLAASYFTGSVQAQPGSLTVGTLIDVPVARCPEKGGIETDLRLYANGGLLSSVRVGIFNRFSIGTSYGGENIIGSGNVNMNPQPCVQLQYLVAEEQFLIPAILIGFNSQGLGGYDKTRKRYRYKSKGLYAVVSKNTSFLAGLGLHVGLSWSPENNDGDSDPTLFAGFHKWINSGIVILGEYDAAINDNSENAVGAGKGYLNLGIRCTLQEALRFEFAWKNILENMKDFKGSSREVKLIYITHF